MPLAVAACAGRWPPRGVRSLVRPIATLLGIMGVAAVAAGLCGYGLGRLGTVTVAGPLAAILPPEKHPAFLTDLWAHDASYLVGVLGELVLIANVWRSRARPSSARSAGPGS